MQSQAVILAGAESGIAGVLFGLVGIPGFLLMLLGGAMVIIDRRVSRGPESSRADGGPTAGRRLFIIGFTMFAATAFFAVASALVL